VKDFDLSSIRMVMSSAAPLSAELTAQLLKVLPGASIGQVYGNSHFPRNFFSLH
jgi:4-coumarate--CoA ligase